MIKIQFKNKRGPHRNNKPYLITSDGTIMYAKNGHLHREDGPAYINELGCELYYLHGKYHDSKTYYKILKKIT